MANFTLPSMGRLRKLLTYIPETGSLSWNRLAPSDFQDGKRTALHSCRIWNSVNAEKPALSCIDASGYLVGGIDYRRTYQHRVIWKWVTGDDPNEIDHINGNRADNRWVNLRNVDRTGNMRNLRRPTTNSTGVIGVHRERKVWVASGSVENKTVVIGRFVTLDEASCARRAWEAERGFHEGHGMR